MCQLPLMLPRNSVCLIQFLLVIEEKDNFQKLAQTALMLGNYEIAEKCLQIMRALDKLNFFYMVIGSQSRLKKMQAVALNQKDPTLRFNTAMLIGDVQERMKVLAETGQSKIELLNIL